MRFTRKLAGPLLAVLMAAGATAATAMPPVRPPLLLTSVSGSLLKAVPSCGACKAT